MTYLQIPNRFPFTSTSVTSHHIPYQLYISCFPSTFSARSWIWGWAHSPPLTTQKPQCAQRERITRKSVGPWQVIAPNGCQHAEMWGHCEERSETRGEYPSLSLFGQEPDLTSKSCRDMNQRWRSGSDKATGRGTCTMFQIQRQNSGTTRDHICVHLFPEESNGSKWSNGSIRQRKITMTALLASADSCVVMGHSSCQIYIIHIKSCWTDCPCGYEWSIK